MDDFEQEYDEVFGENELEEFEEPLEYEEIFETDSSQFQSRERTGDDRISPPFLDRFAKARLIAARAKQLQLGAKPKVPRREIKTGELHEIAMLELEKRVIPLKIVRKFPDGTQEVWSISEFLYIAD